MSKKHFIAIAAELKKQREEFGHLLSFGLKTEKEIRPALGCLDATVARLCHVFETENPKFDSNRFRAACGIK